MPAVLTLLYPTADFDLDYYLKTHMPQVVSKWTPEGLKSWKVVKLDPSSGNTVQTILVFESAEAIGKAVTSEAGKELNADLKNFTTGTPAGSVGELVAES